ncbi:hypothetical protein QR680_013736 [Steinernema hermaphroditum]|uniref:Uncharacterized protein n=1 Tax=Steinernema hermaphroditum TaxID=289476 RepID=A0AA39I8K8_9BILA|nr:hypothetical protein QR680_013736 [Steinernema hermaphroditum]
MCVPIVFLEHLGILNELQEGMANRRNKKKPNKKPPGDALANQLEKIEVRKSPERELNYEETSMTASFTRKRENHVMQVNCKFRSTCKLEKTICVGIPSTSTVCVHQHCYAAVPKVAAPPPSPPRVDKVTIVNKVKMKYGKQSFK